MAFPSVKWLVSGCAALVTFAATLGVARGNNYVRAKVPLLHQLYWNRMERDRLPIWQRREERIWTQQAKALYEGHRYTGPSLRKKPNDSILQFLNRLRAEENGNGEDGGGEGGDGSGSSGSGGGGN